MDKLGFRLRVDWIRFAVLYEVKASITRLYICDVVDLHAVDFAPDWISSRPPYRPLIRLAAKGTEQVSHMRVRLASQMWAGYQSMSGNRWWIPFAAYLRCVLFVEAEFCSSRADICCSGMYPPGYGNIYNLHEASASASYENQPIN